MIAILKNMQKKATIVVVVDHCKAESTSQQKLKYLDEL